MDYVDDDHRPRFLLHSRPSSSSSSLNPNLNAPTPSKLHALFCLAAAAVFLFAGFSLSSSLPFLSSLLLWSSFSLLLAPFAPNSLTGGDIRIGLGPPLPDPDPDPVPDPDPKSSSRAPARRIRPLIADPAPISTSRSEKTPSEIPVANGAKSEMEIVEEEWTESDLEMLKKQMAKHPVGEPRRWERIQEAFRARHGTESVIKMGKSLGERKPGDSDSYERFLKQRKPVDKRVSPVEEGVAGGDGGDGKGWSSGEDLALLNALKAFPKDAAMRWEKVAAAVPGRSKAECVKRIAELKRDFRSAKASQT